MIDGGAPTVARPLMTEEGKLSPSDAELIERCLRKDNAAWELVVSRYRRKVFHISYKFTGRHDDAEDLTQEIFLKVFKSLEKFHRDADFSTWLSSVARNYCIDRYRARKREKEVLVEDLVAFDLAPASAGSNPHARARGPRPAELPAPGSRRAARQAAGGGGPARPAGAQLPGDGRAAAPARRER